MGLAKSLQKDKARTVMGIDSSTHSLALAVFDGTKLVKYGKINFDGNTSYERLVDSRIKMQSLADEFSVDFIAIEKAIMARSVDTAIKMGMALGVIISAVSTKSTKVVAVAPITWQSYIGNKNYTSSQKIEVKHEFPERSSSWIQNKIRERRKRYTIDYFNEKFHINIEDDDVSDAIGIAWYATHNLTR